jgi:hypothetical protein
MRLRCDLGLIFAEPSMSDDMGYCLISCTFGYVELLHFKLCFAMAASSIRFLV